MIAVIGLIGQSHVSLATDQKFMEIWPLKMWQRMQLQILIGIYGRDHPCIVWKFIIASINKLKCLEQQGKCFVDRCLSTFFRQAIKISIFFPCPMNPFVILIFPLVRPDWKITCSFLLSFRKILGIHPNMFEVTWNDVSPWKNFLQNESTMDFVWIFHAIESDSTAPPSCPECFLGIVTIRWLTNWWKQEWLSNSIVHNKSDQILPYQHRLCFET
jgi:hypothetical protein